MKVDILDTPSEDVRLELIPLITLGDIQKRLYPIFALALRVGARLPRPMRVFSFSEITLVGSPEFC
jgi:hypothetical protein